MPKITKARGATSTDDGSNQLEKTAAADDVEKVAVEVEEGETGELVERPGVKESKDVWVAYAESLDIETEGLTKKQLIAAVDKSES